VSFFFALAEEWGRDAIFASVNDQQTSNNVV
jgi:hypothetical protein